MRAYIVKIESHWILYNIYYDAAVLQIYDVTLFMLYDVNIESLQAMNRSSYSELLGVLLSQKISKLWGIVLSSCGIVGHKIIV